MNARTKALLANGSLAIWGGLTGLLLNGRAGERSFSRVIIVAALKRNNGIVSGARLQFEALRELGVDVELIDATPALRNPFFRIKHEPGSAYVFHSGGPQTACLIGSVLPNAARAYRIAYWAWELPDPPASWRGHDRNVSEIWTPSAFSQKSLSRLSSRPVIVVPHRIKPYPARQRVFGKPFTVLAMADARSSFSRKNPEAALRAFRMAFGRSDAAKLVLKLTGPDEELARFERSVAALLGNDIEILKKQLSDTALADLYRSADAYLSLHRSEGFGLPLLEAMAHGMPVVATGWSGNLDFMPPDDCNLVPFRLVPVSDVSAIYSDSVWADPDIEAAATMLRRLANDTDYYARMAGAAHNCAAVAPSFPFTTPMAARTAPFVEAVA